ncbi:MAG: hypothetical protein E7596_01650 [Ruminococcaceae bacterium]|nr:hypothetical protein [Oscillospiraceae bacterium]
MDKRKDSKIMIALLVLAAVVIGTSICVINYKQEVKEKVQYYEDMISGSVLSAHATHKSISSPFNTIGISKYTFTFDDDGTCSFEYKYTPSNINKSADGFSIDNIQWTVTKKNERYFIEFSDLYSSEWNKFETGELEPTLEIEESDLFFAIGVRDDYFDLFFQFTEDK